MEPANVNPPPPDDPRLEALMRQHAAAPPLPDAGFSARVLAALPPRHPPFAWRRAVVYAAGALLGTLVSRLVSGRWPTIATIREPVNEAVRAAVVSASAPWIAAALAIIAMLATVTAAVIFALRDDESAWPPL